MKSFFISAQTYLRACFQFTLIDSSIQLNHYTNVKQAYPPRSMHHTTAVSMLEAGVPLTVIKVFLGHSSIATTEIYAKITQPSLDESVLNWNSSFWSHMTIESKEALTQDVPDEKDDYIPDFLK